MDCYIDRIENGYAVCETQEGRLNVALGLIEGEPKSGDVLVSKGEHFVIDAGASEKRRKKMLSKQNSLWE
ncbi:MAG: DUF3006 domain-containing protein [Ruminococcus sp.]|nr:DUF3006 domain-containing protein [Ruminococcus sp.]